MLCDFSDVLNENLVLIKARAGKCCEKWDAAIEERNRVKQIYSDVLSSLQYLEVNYFTFSLNNLFTCKKAFSFMFYFCNSTS